MRVKTGSIAGKSRRRPATPASETGVLAIARTVPPVRRSTSMHAAVEVVPSATAPTTRRPPTAATRSSTAVGDPWSTTASAPSDRTVSAFRGEAVLTTAYPAAHASWTAFIPTLVEPPQTTTTPDRSDGASAAPGSGSPRCRGWNSAHAAVDAPSGRTAACSNGTSSGSTAVRRSRSAVCSWNAPSCTGSRPRSVPVARPTTRSPTRKREMPDPTATTSPAASEPSTAGVRSQR